MNDTLPSWHDTPTKQAIIDFVAAVTDEASPQYVPPTERIAVFDNDGTLWCEKPMYIQMDFILRKLAAAAAADPALRTRQPWQAAWAKDFAWFGAAMTKHYQGDDGDLRVLLGGILALSDGQAVEEVEAAAQAFVEHERHPTLGRDVVVPAVLPCGSPRSSVCAPASRSRAPTAAGPARPRRPGRHPAGDGA